MNPAFTPEPPTKPGWYAFKYDGGRNVFLADISQHQIDKGCYQSTERLWCRLVPESGTVPKEEVERAWREGAEYGDESRMKYEHGGDYLPMPEAWLESRARKVMEGEV